jgi:predicted phage terminase large subunit-like protein
MNQRSEEQAPPVSQRRLLEAILRQNLSAFTERCFNELEPAHRYLHNWHLDAIAHHLSQVAKGECKRLVITMPPRSLKSLAASIAFPAWILGHDPRRRIICVSYGRSLTTAHANSFRAIVNSAWYRNLFPLMRIDPRKDTEDEVRTVRGGYRLTATVGGALTGRGGSTIVIDDALKALDAQSEAARRTANTWFDETLLSRLDDKRTDAIVLVMQRLHPDDIVGHVLKSANWTHLDLPAIAPEDALIRTGPGSTYRRPAGELLHPEREPRPVLDELKQAMGSMAFSAQYLQRPVPLDGNLIRWEWFRTWTQLPDRQRVSEIIQSWDTASKAAELNDYSVGITALRERNTIYVLDVVRARLEYPSLKKRIISEQARWKATKVLIEDKGSGTSLVQDLRRDSLYAVAIQPDGDKVVRMAAGSAAIEDGRVHLPANAPWLDDFRAELLAFPNGIHDDQVDALSQLINWAQTRSTLMISDALLERLQCDTVNRSGLSRGYFA